MWKLIYRREDYSLFGLNNRRNFLTCNTDKKLKFNSFDDTIEFVNGLLINHGCPNAAVFMVGQDGKMYTALSDVDFDFDDYDEDDDYYDDYYDEYYDEEYLNDDIGDEDDDCVEFIVSVYEHDFDLNWFSDIDADKRLCCYSVLIETEKGIWKILED